MFLCSAVDDLGTFLYNLGILDMPVIGPALIIMLDAMFNFLGCTPQMS